MKFKLVFFFVILLYSVSNTLYSNIDTLFNSEIIREKPVSNGLYISQSLYGSYNPVKMNAETTLYYRLAIFTNKEGFLWNGTKADFGIENNFSLSSDMIGLFIDVKPLSFISVRVSAYYDFMFDAMKFGYAGFDSNNVNYSYRDLEKMNKGTAFGYILNVSPSLFFKFEHFTLLDTFTFSYVNVGNKPYYYDPRTAILHKKSEMELLNDFYILGNINPFYIGAYYGIVYLINSKIFTHKMGIAAILNFSFLKDRLMFDIGILAGLHLSLPYYDEYTFIESKVLLSYKIF